MLPALVVLLAAVALGAIFILQSEANAGRDAQLKLARLKGALTELQFAPFQADPRVGRSVERSRLMITRDRRQVDALLSTLRRDSPAPTLDMVEAPLRNNYATLGKIYAIAISGVGFDGRGERLARASDRSHRRINRALRSASVEYDSRASSADAKATIGSAATIAILVLAFLFLYRGALRARTKAEGLAEENGALAAAAGHDARTDALTGLGNRRALTDDLAAALGGSGSQPELAVALFDLDGFKQYNDTFGHPAGDALLSRLGERLFDLVAGSGRAYRMGGDEFCVLARPASRRDRPARRGGGKRL